MTSTRPYLIRAFFDWIVDNGLTPYVLVDASLSGVRVPAAHVRDGRIVLNIAPGAVADLQFGTEFVTFGARFAGVAQDISMPVLAVMAIYARENGQGMFFGDEDAEDSVSPQAPDIASGALAGEVSAAPARPVLRLVK